MFRYLPALKKTLLFLLMFSVVGLQFFIFTAKANAQVPPPNGSWVSDDEVTFVGKAAARSGSFLDWTLANYNWSFVAGGQSNPLSSFWASIRNIVYALFALVVLVTAFIMIATRGKSITVMRFIPRFILIVFLVTFSFALVQFIYQIIDAVQGFFLRNPDLASMVKHPFIWQGNLLYVGWNYGDFLGYRVLGPSFDESAFISLLLIKLTTVTYYTLSGILLLRKIILWFFIVISPIFPLLLLYSPVRNTAKIWVGEFFRWLLYAPIFAIFLSGLVHLWRSGVGIPLKFDFANVVNRVEYPTAINILLGGPGQILSYASPVQSNSLNNSDTFAQYVVALLMLWVVIILPFLLLQIFLDYIHDFSVGENTIIKQLMTSGSAFINRAGKGPTPLPPPVSAPAGIARSLPFIPNKVEIPQIRATETVINTQAANIRGREVGSDILRLANLSIPTMQDVAKYETALLSSDIGKHQEIARVHETLEGIANPRRVATPTQRQHYNLMQERLKQESQKGNPLASSILSAADVVTKSSLQKKGEENARLGNLFSKINNLDSVSLSQERDKLSIVKTSLTQAAQNGDPLANSVLSAMKEGKGEIGDELRDQLLKAKEKGSSLAASILQEAGVLDVGETSMFPVANRVQTVSIDDYETVKKIWQENYQKLEPPRTIEGKQKNRKEWIAGDIDKITETINLLTSTDHQNVTKGMEAVSAILPFLLIGGFAQTEVIAYLKAKLEAAKTVISEIGTAEEEEETTIEASSKKDEKPKEMEMHEQSIAETGEADNKKGTEDDNH